MDHVQSALDLDGDHFQGAAGVIVAEIDQPVIAQRRTLRWGLADDGVGVVDDVARTGATDLVATSRLRLRDLHAPIIALQ